MWDLLFFLMLLIILLLLIPGLLDRKIEVKDILSLCIALAALVSSWIGLYLSTLRPFLRRPQLKYSELIQRSDPTEGEKQQGWQPSWFLKLRIENKGQIPAQNCVGRLLEVRANGKRIDSFDSLNLYWMRQSQPDDFRPINIQGHGDFFWLDVGQIKRSENVLSMRVVIQSGERLVLDPDFPEAPDLPPGKYFVCIGVYAEEGYIEPIWFKIEWEDVYSREPPCSFEKVKKPE
jgi:hypothetical protein